MGLPHVFEPGEVAAASEVNANFRYLADILGEDSTAELVTLRGLKVGNGAFLSPDASQSLLTWNTLRQQQGTGQVFVRNQTNMPASIVGLGQTGFEIRTTSATTGDLNTQLKTVFAARATKSENWFYMDPTWSIQRVNSQPKTIEDYRLTYVQLDDPVTIYEDATNRKSAGSAVHDMYRYGVPKNAKMVRMLSYVTALPASGAAMILMQARQKRHRKFGMIVHGYGGNAAYYGRSGGQGDVPIGTGAYAGRIYEERTAGFEVASLYLQGYWI